MDKLSRIFLITDTLKELELKYDNLANSEIINSETLATCIAILKEQINGIWIPIDERLPTKREYDYNDGRIIVTDGNRVYQSLFDIYEKCFIDVIYKGNCNFEHIIDNKIIAWQVLPKKPYKEKKNNE